LDIVDVDQNIPYPVSPLGMMINLDEYLVGSQCYIESAFSNESFGQLDTGNLEWYGDIKIPENLDY
jgi:hypothetical protein